jgi:glycosyltransferase involved in cell wall biosynthesis
MPSRSEAFGLATLEAMRNKRAVIASRVGGLKELVIEGVNGRFIDINDIQACREVLLELNKDELRRMGALGFELFEKEFRWDVCYSKWHALFEQVLAKP